MTALNLVRGGRDAAPGSFPIPTDAADPDAALWRLVEALMKVNETREAAGRMMSECAHRDDKEGGERIEKEIFTPAHDAGTVLELEIFSTPARTPRGLMVKVQMAVYWLYGTERNIDEPALPPLPLAADYFSAEPLDGGDSFDRRAASSLWRDAVALFGYPPLLDPEWTLTGREH